MFKKKKIKNIAVCSKCGEEIEWIKSDKGKMYAINLGKTERNNDYFHSSTCSGLENQEPETDIPKTETAEKKEEVKEEPKPEEKKEMTIGDVLNNHELRLKEMEITVLKMLEHFGRVYLEGDNKK